MLKNFVTVALALVLLSSISEARKKKQPDVQKFSGVVQNCHDGDTCRVLVDGKIG